MNISHLCTVGLTGGLASGKSTVARLLEGRGAVLCDADQIVASLYRPGQQGAEAVVGLFGGHVLTADGSIDRDRLAQTVLDDQRALEKLNAAIHPLVRREIQQWITKVALEEPRPPMAVVEAALMVESGSYRDYDAMAVVWCRRQQQLERAIQRGVPEDRAHKLLDAQLELTEKCQFADLVIDNSGAPKDLADEVAKAWPLLVDMCPD